MNEIEMLKDYFGITEKEAKLFKKKSIDAGGIALYEDIINNISEFYRIQALIEFYELKQQ